MDGFCDARRSGILPAAGAYLTVINYKDGLAENSDG
jgi:hypothetical protein